MINVPSSHYFSGVEGYKIYFSKINFNCFKELQTRQSQAE